MKRRVVACSLGAVVLAGPVHADGGDKTEANSLKKVEVQGRSSDAARQRESVAGRLIIGRQTLEASTADTVAAVLRREPSITVNADGRLGLMGLPGYTMILVDGQPPAPGVRPLEFGPERIERIEIIKGATAELGAMGIAGTINLITRNPRRQLPATLGATLAGPHADRKARINGMWGWRDPQTRRQLNLMASWSDSNQVKQGTETWGLNGAPQTQRGERSLERGEASRWASVNGKLSLPGGEGDDWTLRFDALDGRVRQSRQARTVDGLEALPAVERSHEQQDLQAFDTGLKWGHRVAEGLILELDGGANRSRTVRKRSSELPGSLASLDRETNEPLQGTFRLKLTDQRDERHQWTYGLSLKQVNQDQQRTDGVLGQSGADATSHASSARLRSMHAGLHVEDEWSIDDSLSASLGLRHDRRRETLVSPGTSADSDLALWAPSFNLSWRLDPEGKRQWRLGVARTYKMLAATQLDPRPAINVQGICLDGRVCESNRPDQPDLAGNPLLKPQKAWGIDLSYEHSWGRASSVNVSAFARAIDELLSTQLQWQEVGWSPVKRWVSRPVNAGSALARGLALGLSSRLDDLVDDAPKLGISAGLNVSRSHVSTLPGPDNRLDEQPRWSAKLGISYSVPSAACTLEVDADWLPAAWIQQGVAERSYANSRRMFSLGASWVLDGGAKLKLTARNIAGSSIQAIQEVRSDSLLQTVASRERSTPQWMLRWEQAL